MDMSRVADLMTKDVICQVGKDATVQEAAKTMKGVGRGCLVVIDNAQLSGIITERDLVQRVMAEGLAPSEVRVSQIMSKPVITVGPEALVSDAAKIMVKNRIRRLVITEGQRVVGILTATDLAEHLRRKARSDPMLAAMARAAQMEQSY